MTDGSTFDPTRYLTKVGGRDYLEVKWRLVWLRALHPGARVVTNLVEHRPGEMAVFVATVTLPPTEVEETDLLTGEIVKRQWSPSATGWGSEGIGDFGDYLEKAECVPLTVPILTRRGWRYYHQISAGEEVLGYDVDRGEMVWTTVRQVSTFDNQPLVQIGNSRFSAVCTRDHKWVLDGTLIPWNERKGGGRERVTLAAPLAMRGGSVTDAARLGWLMTDAQIEFRGGLPSSAEVRQAKPEHFERLDDLFGESTARDVPDRVWPGGSVSTVLPLRTWHVAAADVRRVLGTFGVATRDDLPEAVLGMSRDEAQAFFDAAMAADGSSGTSPAFAKSHLPVVEAVQLAALLTGRSSGVIKERAPNAMTTKPCYMVGIHKGGAKYTSEFRTTPLPPQSVWCPTTDTGTWVGNFNGFIGITGNTKALGRALAALGFGTQFCWDFEFGAEQQRVVDAPTELRGGDRRPSSGGNRMEATPRQFKYLHAVAREVGLSNEDIEARSQHAFGCGVAELNRRDISQLIEQIQAERGAASLAN